MIQRQVILAENHFSDNLSNGNLRVVWNPVRLQHSYCWSEGSGRDWPGSSGCGCLWTAPPTSPLSCAPRFASDGPRLYPTRKMILGGGFPLRCLRMSGIVLGPLHKLSHFVFITTLQSKYTILQVEKETVKLSDCPRSHGWWVAGLVFPPKALCVSPEQFNFWLSARRHPAP